MPRNVYSELNLHITWHTKQSLPLITAVIEPRLHAFLRHRVLETPGVIFHAIGGTGNHVHLAVSVPSTLLVSDWIGKLKGASAHYINHEVTKRKSLEWQSGYGVVSFGSKDLKWVVDYISNQKEHHTRGTMRERLERTEGSSPGEEAR